MNALLNYWALLNTIIIMLGLGLAEHSADRQSPWPLLRAAIGYNVLIPAILLIAVKQSFWFSAETLAAMSLCIAAAGGTSAGAFVGQVQGSARLASQLIVLLVGVSLAAIALFSYLNWITLGAVSLPRLAMYLTAITVVPLVAGRVLRAYFPVPSARWKPQIDSAGSLLVILLVLALAIRYGREIVTGPSEPLWAALILVLMFVLPPFFENETSLRRTIVLITLIRNLSLVLSILALLPTRDSMMPTVMAFGLFMYVTTGVLVWRWRLAGKPAH